MEKKNRRSDKKANEVLRMERKTNEKRERERKDVKDNHLKEHKMISKKARKKTTTKDLSEAETSD